MGNEIIARKHLLRFTVALLYQGMSGITNLCIYTLEYTN